MPDEARELLERLGVPAPAERMYVIEWRGTLVKVNARELGELRSKLNK